jgi:menaquinone-dependent protoporphyrinogen oxidase
MLMNVLIVAATRHGSTLEIAQEIAVGLATGGASVEIRGPEEVRSLLGFDAVVVGSAVYAGQWLSPAKAFVDRFLPDLQERPVWLFSSGPLGDPPLPAEDPAGVKAIIDAARPKQHRIFAGRLNRSELGLVEKVVVATVRAPDGDFRDREAARAWGREIADSLTPASPALT